MVLNYGSVWKWCLWLCLNLDLLMGQICSCDEPRWWLVSVLCSFFYVDLFFIDLICKYGLWFWFNCLLRFFFFLLKLFRNGSCFMFHQEVKVETSRVCISFIICWCLVMFLLCDWMRNIWFCDILCGKLTYYLWCTDTFVWHVSDPLAYFTYTHEVSNYKALWWQIYNFLFSQCLINVIYRW